LVLVAALEGAALHQGDYWATGPGKAVEIAVLQSDALHSASTL
jgi:hypothetical protein